MTTHDTISSSKNLASEQVARIHLFARSPDEDPREGEEAVTAAERFAAEVAEASGVLRGLHGQGWTIYYGEHLYYDLSEWVAERSFDSLDSALGSALAAGARGQALEWPSCSDDIVISPSHPSL